MMCVVHVFEMYSEFDEYLCSHVQCSNTGVGIRKILFLEVYFSFKNFVSS